MHDVINGRPYFDSGLPASEITSIVNLVTTFMLLSIVMTILMPILSGRVIVVPNTNHNKADDGIGVLKSLENLFFGDNEYGERNDRIDHEEPAGYYDENGYYQGNPMFESKNLAISKSLGQY